MTGSGDARRDLGRRLADARKAAGYTQAGLAAAVGYSRSTVSNAEIGHPDIARVFWARCDSVLQTGRSFARSFDQVRVAERRQAAGLPDDAGPAEAAGGAGLGAARRARQQVSSGRIAEALAGYRELGWAAESAGDGLELVTGDGLEVLELPRAAGMLAVSLWLYSRGRPDEVRRLPALPHPAQALAVITAGDRCFFLAAAGGCPWTGSEAAAVPGDRGGGGAGGVICWHAGGARVPAPPSGLPGGERAAWAHLPARQVRLAPSIGLLSLLGTAAAAACGGPPGLTLPGGIRVVPAPRPRPAR